MENAIKELMKKNPSYRTHFLNIYKKNPNTSFDLIKEVYEILVDNKQILKQHGFNFQQYKTIESLNDEVHRIVLNHKSKTYAKSFVSNKHLSIFNDRTYDLFRVLYEKNISKRAVRDLIIKKIAKYSDGETFNSDLAKIIDNFSEHNMASVLEKVRGLEGSVEVAYKNDDENILILSVKDYQASSSLGSRSWCISTSANYWNNYFFERIFNDVEVPRTQLFYFNFEKDPTDVESMIGITVSVSGEVYTSHLKNDSSYNKNSAKRIIEDANLVLETKIDNIKDVIMERVSDIPKAIELLSKHCEFQDAFEHFYNSLGEGNNKVFDANSITIIKDNIVPNIQKNADVEKLLTYLFRMLAHNDQLENALGVSLVGFRNSKGVKLEKVIHKLDADVKNKVYEVLFKIAQSFNNMFNSSFSADFYRDIYKKGIIPSTYFTSVNLKGILEDEIIDNGKVMNISLPNHHSISSINKDTILKLIKKYKSENKLDKIETLISLGFNLEIPFEREIKEEIEKLEDRQIINLLRFFKTKNIRFDLVGYIKNTEGFLNDILKGFLLNEVEGLEAFKAELRQTA